MFPTVPIDPLQQLSMIECGAIQSRDVKTFAYAPLCKRSLTNILLFRTNSQKCSFSMPNVFLVSVQLGMGISL